MAAQVIMNFAKFNRDAWNTVLGQGYIEGSLRANPPIPFYEVNLMDGCRGAKILDICCCSGQRSEYLAEQGARVVGIDFSGAAIRLAGNRIKSASRDVIFREQDITTDSWNLECDFDKAFLFNGVLEWIPNLSLFLSNLWYHLKPGGCVVMFDHHPIVSHLRWNGRHWQFRRGKSNSQVVGIQRFYLNPDIRFPPVPAVTFTHTISSLLAHLVKCGFTIETFVELPFLGYSKFANMEMTSAGMWKIRDDPFNLPLAIQILAKKPL